MGNVTFEQKSETTTLGYSDIFPVQTGTIGSRTNKYIQTYNAAQALSWVPLPFTWAYSSADSPIYVISIAGDVTGFISVGMKLRMTNSTVKYFIVHAVGSYSGGVTLVTVYGGTDYTLVNAAISSPCLSYNRAPFGFPMDPDKWSVALSDTTNATQASPTNNTYYNLGSLSLVVPIGVWDTTFSWSAEIVVTTTALRNIGIASALSTSTSSVSDAELRASLGVTGPTGANTLRLIMNKRKILSISSKTTYYAIVLGSVATDAITSISLRGDLGNTIAKVVCAYL